MKLPIELPQTPWDADTHLDLCRRHNGIVVPTRTPALRIDLIYELKQEHIKTDFILLFGSEVALRNVSYEAIMLAPPSHVVLTDEQLRLGIKHMVLHLRRAQFKVVEDLCLPLSE